MTAPEPTPTYEVCGIAIAALAPEQAASAIVENAIARRPFEVHLCNAYTLSLVDDDARLKAALSRAHLNLPDGTPVAWLGRGRGIRRAVRGPGLVRQVAGTGAPRGLRHYFYGGAPGVAAELATRLQQEHPGLEIAGAESPPYGEPSAEALDAAANRMRAAQAHIVWIGLGTPRQDYVVPLLADRIECAVVPVGAAFDFLTGRVKEAPQWLHGTGAEWAFRLASEPRRLWARYLIGNPRFLASAARHKLRS